LIEHGRAAGDERGAGDRFGHCRAVERAGGAEVVARGAGRDDQEIEPRLGERDVVGQERARSPCARDRYRGCRVHRHVLHARPRAGTAMRPTTTGAPASGSTVAPAKRERHVRSVNTSDVVSTIAPQTTWKLLIHGSRRLRTVSAPSVTCAATRTRRRSAG